MTKKWGLIPKRKRQSKLMVTKNLETTRLVYFVTKSNHRASLS